MLHKKIQLKRKTRDDARHLVSSYLSFLSEVYSNRENCLKPIS